MAGTATGAHGKQTVTIPVSGMTCAACSGRVQRTLSKQAGVDEAAVNLMMNNATVTFDPASDLAGARWWSGSGRRATGRSCRRAERTAFEEQEAQDRAQEEEFRELRAKAVGQRWRRRWWRCSSRCR